MYRVELKERKLLLKICGDKSFLMYRVELKALRVPSTLAVLGFVPNVPCGVERYLRNWYPTILSRS